MHRPAKGCVHTVVCLHVCRDDNLGLDGPWHWQDRADGAKTCVQNRAAHSINPAWRTRSCAQIALAGRCARGTQVSAPPIGWRDTVRAGQVGSRLSGGTILPLSSGWNVWQAPRLPSKRGRCSLRCETMEVDTRVKEASQGSGRGWR
eukprot:1298040-Prymnesium_polylepis.2